MKLNNFWFGFLFCLSLVVIVVSFCVGASSRSCNAIGGEMFTLILPYFIIKWKFWTIKTIRKGRKK